MKYYNNFEDKGKKQTMLKFDLNIKKTKNIKNIPDFFPTLYIKHGNIMGLCIYILKGSFNEIFFFKRLMCIRHTNKICS